MQTQTKTQINNEITKEQNKQFIKPLSTIMALCKLDLTEQELLQREDFRKVIAELREIAKQGRRQEFERFAKMVILG